MLDAEAIAKEVDRQLREQGAPDEVRMRAVSRVQEALGVACRATERARADEQAAGLMDRGARRITERQGCHRSTAYRRAMRARCRGVGAQRDK